MEWFRHEIITGIQKLAVLGLERQPSAEVLPATVSVWLEVLDNGSHWDMETDTPRIRAAFSTLARTATSWPSPQRMLEALPKKGERLALPAKPVDPETAAANIREIMSLLNAPRDPEPVAEDRPPLAEIEAGLQRHYIDKKRQAAGEGGNDDHDGA